MKKYTITVNGTAYEVEVEDMGGAAATAPKAAAPKAAPAPAAAPAPKAAAPAPADGTISDVRVSAGQTVGTGDVMIVM